MNDCLAICIPTYNRATHLRGCLEHLLPLVAKQNLAIYVSDNASSDETPKVVSEFQTRYNNIRYFRNNENLGTDANFAKVLKLSHAKYSWLLCDDNRLTPDAILKMLAILDEKDYALVVVNGGKLKGKMEEVSGRVQDHSSSLIFTDQNRLLAEIGWHMTWASCLVFSHKMIKEAEFDKYYDTNFLQHSVIFNYLAGREFKVLWLPDALVYNVDYEMPLWFPSVFDIWITRWSRAINDLPASYTPRAKARCLLDHGVKSRLFSLFYFVGFRLLNYYNFKLYLKHRPSFPKVTNLNNTLLLLIALLPIPFFAAQYFRRHLASLYELINSIKFWGK
ncbi:MAG: glycosyltransferase family 2 protein [Candidatus Saganbacteria bacterium]|nr:glycosyltransferase family 2 protein [Candidatus Saganbacteria bacterium]